MDVSLTEISDLPDEVLCEIFSYLPPKCILKTIMKVSKRWKSIIHGDKLFWKHLQLVIHCDYFLNCSYLDSSTPNNRWEALQSTQETNEVYIGEHDLDKVSKVQFIKLTEGSQNTSRPALLVIRVLDVISKICKDIKKIESSNCFGATSNNFIEFLKEKYCNINEIRYGINAVSIIPYKEIAGFTFLKTLVSHDYHFKRQDLYTITDNCEHMNSLWLLFSRSLQNEDILYFLEKKKGVLKEIGLGMSLQDCVFEKLKECLKLEVLFVADARYISDSCVRDFKYLPSLKYFSLHLAKIQPPTISDWLLYSAIPPQLIIFDLTDYCHLKEGHWITFPQKCPLTFTNTIYKAVTIPHSSYKPGIHWMYQQVL